MSTQDSVAGYAYWISQDESTKVIYSLAVANDIDVLVNDGYRRIPHGGVESGGFLFGTRNNGVAKIEAFQAIDCQHAFGPSFVLSDRDLENMRTQLRASKSNDELAGLRPLGWFLGHTRSPFEVSERELTWFNEFFPEPGGLILLVKPERFQATRFAVLVRDAGGQLERDGSRSSFILPLSGQNSLGQSPSPSIPAPEKTVALPPPASHFAPSPVTPPAEPAPVDNTSDREKTGSLPPPPFSEVPAPQASSSLGNPLPPPTPPSEKKAVISEPEPEKSDPPPASPFRKTPRIPPETTAPSTGGEGQKKSLPEREPPRLSEFDVPKPMGGQVTRIHSVNPGTSTPPFSAETRPISQRNVIAPASGSSGKVQPPQQAAEDPKLAYPYASLPPTRVRAAQRRNVEAFGWRSAAVLLLAAVLGCIAGYWAYLQLPSPVIPVSVREQRGQFVVEWPSAQTDNVDYAALQVNDGQWVTLTADEKSAGRALITPPATGDLKIDLLAKHWLRDSRGIVRYIRTPR